MEKVERKRKSAPVVYCIQNLLILIRITFSLRLFRKTEEFHCLPERVLTYSYLIITTICRTERDNFRRVKQALEVERARAKAASDRDAETIIDLRTNLEVERE